jgi:hypothetical protein
MELSTESKPSISVRSWLSVCSRSSLLESDPRALAMASSSSMKMMHGALLAPRWNRSRTLHRVQTNRRGADGVSGSRLSRALPSHSPASIVWPGLVAFPQRPQVFHIRVENQRMTDLAAPLPTKTSTKSLAEQEMKGTPASVATARASSVFPVPLGPGSATDGDPRE